MAKAKNGIYSANDFTSKEKEELDITLHDISQGKNIAGPFNSAEEFISSLKK